MRNTSVLHVITRLIVGGAQENTALTAVGQHKAGLDVTVVAGIDDGPEGNLHERVRAAGVELHLMKELVRPIAPIQDVVALARLASFIRRGKFDVVHTHSSKAGILGRLAARMAGTPIVVHTLHSLVFGDHATPLQNAIYLRAKRLCAPYTHKFISVADATRKGALAAGIGTSDKHVTIYSGFEIRPFLQIRDQLSIAEAKRRIGLDPDVFVVGKIARLFLQKGHDHFFNAARIIAEREPRAHFLLVGDGILRHELEQRAQDYGIAGRVTFTGLVPPEDVPALMQAMDVVVHTSIREGLPRVIPQAAAVGKPVVAFALDGSPEVVHHGETGFLSAPLNHVQVAEQVLDLLGNSTRRRVFGENGRALVRDNFSAEVMVRRINHVYFELATKGLGRVAATNSADLTSDLQSKVALDR